MTARNSEDSAVFQKPPYTITMKAADYLAKIVETVTRLELGTGWGRDIKLHRENRVRTIYSSLAIEGNTLSLDEVTAVIAGKPVAGKQTEIKEVKNAYEAYDKIMTFDRYAVGDFLEAHKLMMGGLIEEAGKFRSGDVGVFDGGKALHIGARPQFVPKLTEELFGWAKETELHPVLKSAVLHYEIEIIHPFADGNGRMGRLWQTLTLAKWNALFAWVPMESVLYESRPQYYQAIEEARKANDSGVFIEFTLSAILDTVMAQEKHQAEHKDKHTDKHIDKHTDKHIDKHTDKHRDKHIDKHRDKHIDKHMVEQLPETMSAVLKALEAKSLSRNEIFAAIGLNKDYRAFKRNVEPLLANGYIEMTVPDKPSSKLQKYRLTDKGKAALEK
ncbi:MAG: Fic family protein [Clostridiales Family XIII bacterium]|jgi:Fic family protein|nr:Fic family protein [Clostridiales Family XIII bacterium]